MDQKACGIRAVPTKSHRLRQGHAHDELTKVPSLPTQYHLLGSNEKGESVIVRPSLLNVTRAILVHSAISVCRSFRHTTH